MKWFLLALFLVNTEAGTFRCPDGAVQLDPAGVPSSKAADGTLTRCAAVIETKSTI